MSNLNKLNPLSLITDIPSPPENLNVASFMGDHLAKRWKSPNAFILYRRDLMNHLRSRNCHMKMSEISKMASRHWRNEKEGVKNDYKKIAKELNTEYSEIRAHNPKFDEILTPYNILNRKF